MDGRSPVRFRSTLRTTPNDRTERHPPGPTVKPPDSVSRTGARKQRPPWQRWIEMVTTARSDLIRRCDAAVDLFRQGLAEESLCYTTTFNYLWRRLISSLPTGFNGAVPGQPHHPETPAEACTLHASSLSRIQIYAAPRIAPRLSVKTKRMTMIDFLPYLPTGGTAMKEQKDRRLPHGRERLRRRKDLELNAALTATSASRVAWEEPECAAAHLDPGPLAISRRYCLHSLPNKNHAGSRCITHSTNGSRVVCKNGTPGMAYVAFDVSVSFCALSANSGSSSKTADGTHHFDGGVVTLVSGTCQLLQESRRRTGFPGTAVRLPRSVFSVLVGGWVRCRCTPREVPLRSQPLVLRLRSSNPPTYRRFFVAPAFNRTASFPKHLHTLHHDMHLVHPPENTMPNRAMYRFKDHPTTVPAPSSVALVCMLVYAGVWVLRVSWELSLFFPWHQVVIAAFTPQTQVPPYNRLETFDRLQMPIRLLRCPLSVWR
ncbi:hypothetical protein B0T21DRAFT_345417 [Apiosordaria backusii]|uniref:Uncharacterized protein n=1 Tax=Apiosordaria backusii TaxID=314023 RepID=A0AA40ETS1_9PEZI|nr:hypothetical protein B0T21DRAFT_345417 [Apiosordaria backusii]